MRRLLQRLPDRPSAPARIDAAPTDGDWPLHGRNEAEDRFSPLDEIRADNVARLGMAWSFEFDNGAGGTSGHPVETTPLVVGGRIYFTAPWSVVWAIDARTKSKLWSFDPKVPRSVAWKGFGALNRGVAYHDGEILVATYDGRLIALDASSGREIWSVMTVDITKPYTITGAPRIADGK